jgi:hypothetical protein
MTFSEWFVDEQLCKGKISLKMITRLIASKYSFVGDFFFVKVSKFIISV